MSREPQHRRQSEPDDALPGSARFTAVLALAARHRGLLTGVADALVWVVALTLAVWLRYEFHWPAVDEGGLLVMAAIAAVLQVALGRAYGLYRGRWRFGSFEEVFAVVLVVAVVTGLLVAVDQVPDVYFVPTSAVLVAGFITVVLTCATRYGWRLYLDSVQRPTHDEVRRAVVYGAGDAAHQLVRSMTTSPSSPLLPVAAVDDAPHLRDHRLTRHVRVEGTGEDLVEVARRHDAEVVILAVAGADQDLVRRVVAEADPAGLEVQVLPPLWELPTPDVDVSDVRRVTINDLLGRREIDLDVAGVAGYLTGRRVLVTGAGGSIGSELCRQIDQFAPSALIMLDRDESALHALQLSLDHEGRVDDEDLVVADIRDAERLREVFWRCRPDVVFHAAALKHVPLLELHPHEAIKTNIIGTRHVLEAAVAAGVDRFINISTDKAADPVNVLGYTKCLAERLTAGVGQDADGTYCSVRFGNVLGSRGSVLTTFEHQVTQGGPVTVTDEDVTRYFMTVQEAVQLVIQAGAVGADGDVLVLDMGRPVRIADVARRLAEAAEPPVPVVFTGLRPGEKLIEVLVAEGEEPRPTGHELVFRVGTHALTPDQLGAPWAEDPRPTLQEWATGRPAFSLRTDRG